MISSYKISLADNFTTVQHEDTIKTTIQPLTDSDKDKGAGIQDNEMSDILLITDTAGATSSCRLFGRQLSYVDLTKANLRNMKIDATWYNIFFPDGS